MKVREQLNGRAKRRARAPATLKRPRAQGARGRDEREKRQPLPIVVSAFERGTRTHRLPTGHGLHLYGLAQASSRWANRYRTVNSVKCFSVQRVFPKTEHDNQQKKAEANLAPALSSTPLTTQPVFSPGFEKSTFGASRAPGVVTSKYDFGSAPMTFAVSTAGKRRMYVLYARAASL